ncbi:MAG: AgmX/PglI C-terminal domain-containing protein [Deltaproteobacteria bacterium]
MTSRILALAPLMLALTAFASQTLPAWLVEPLPPALPPAWPALGPALVESSPERPGPRIALGEVSGTLHRHRWRRVRRAAQTPAQAALPDEALGALSVRAAIRAIGPVVQRCYDAALRLDPDLHGDPVFRLRVAKAGRVDAVAIERDVQGSPAMTDCFTRALSSIRMPASAAGLDVEVPFLLEPEKAPNAEAGALARE